MLSACTKTVRRNIILRQSGGYYYSGGQHYNNHLLLADIPGWIQPLVCFFQFNTADCAFRSITNQSSIRTMSTVPPPQQFPPTGPRSGYGGGGGNTGTDGNNFRQGGGNGGFRLRRPDPRGGGFPYTGGRGGGGGRGRGRGRGGELDGQNGSGRGGGNEGRDFGLGGGSNYGGRNSPPTLNKKNIFPNLDPIEAAEKGTRTNAVSVLPGNYFDDDDNGYSDDEYGIFGDDDEEENNESDTDTTQSYDPTFVPDDPEEIEQQKLLKQHLLQEQEKREKWIDNALPPERTSIIDERGRAYGRGGRKSAQARVWIQPGLGEVIVNRRRFTDYFDRLYDREQVLAPFVATETCNMFDVQVMVKGGGLTGQAGAIRLGVARALNAYNPDLYRPPLKFLGYLTRDARKVERKKIGRTKARKSPQWVRR